MKKNLTLLGCAVMISMLALSCKKDDPKPYTTSGKQTQSEKGSQTGRLPDPK